MPVRMPLLVDRAMPPARTACVPDLVLDMGFAQFAWLWNHIEDRALPDLHRTIADWLDGAVSAEDGARRALLMAFRDAGKSTVVGLFCAWLLARNPDLRILVLAAEAELARKMTRSVRRLIEKHPACRHLLPDRAEQWAADRLSVKRRLVQRDPSLLARGVGANITGCRADVIICDDVEVPNTAGTADKRRELRERLAETAYVLVPDGLHLYVGTPHAFHSIYATEARPEFGESVPFLHGFDRLVLPIVDARGRSAWPERFPMHEIEGLKRRTGPAKFTSQMLLQPVSTEEIRLDPADLVRYDAPLALHEGNNERRLMLGDRRIVGARCWWDPAFGRPGKGDASVIALVLNDEDGGHFLHAIQYLRHEPARVAAKSEVEQLCEQAARFAQEHHVPSVTLEANGIGKTFPGVLRNAMATMGVGAAVIEHHSRRNKVERILEAFDPVMAARQLNVHASVWRTPFIQEMREWRPSSTARDDGLDAVAGCILSAPVRITRMPAAPRTTWHAGGQPLAARAGFNPFPRHGRNP
ncbi:phage terminase large subunit [Marinivivus vitaminiproducens]|uniref:phage terminase large subunit n=1 Tax=Marinivivus vitaminiproducens TaxID=3035935 RepID=UPI0027A6FF06|nr:phage terminase large subunit [Geminicoccaceae bacterium SCSIO 64248]